MTPRLLDELRAEALRTGKGIESRFRTETRPRIAALLVDAGLVEIRRTAGEDVASAECAIEASLANLALEERTALQAEVRDMVFRALVAVVRVGLAVG